MAGLSVFAGRLRKSIRIESEPETSDGSGGTSAAWTLVAETRAFVQPMSGRERLLAQTAGADLSHTIAIRYRTGVTPKCRLVMGTRVFNILSVIDPEEMHRELVLSCTEIFGAAP